MKRFHHSLLFMSISVAAGSVYANQDVRLDSLVISASGFEQKITDAPASISVITKEDLASKPYMTLLDAVRDVEGIDVGETSDKTGQGSISMRGMGSDYTLILINGKRQNNVGDLYPNSFGGNQFNHIPPLDTIERIEVIRGPMSTLYGADAMGGVINIITKRVSDEWTGSITHSRTYETNKDFGNDTTTDFSVSGPLIENVLGLSVRGSYYDRDQSNPTYASVTAPDGTVFNRTLGFGGGGRTVDNNNWTGGLTLAYKPHEKHDIIFDYDTSVQKYDNDSSQLGTLDSLATVWRASGGRVQPRVGYTDNQEFTRDQWSITHEAEWGDINSDISFSYVKTNNNGRTLPFTVEERGRLQGLWDASGGNLNNLTEVQRAELDAFLPRPARVMETRQKTLDVKFDTVQGDHWLIFGGQYIDAEQEDGVFGMYGDGFRSGTVQPHKQWALFVEDNWDVLEDVTLTGGVRYDNHNVFGSQVSPRAYGVWNLASDWTLKGGVSTGYKTPKTSDLFPGITGFGGQGTSPFVGSPDLQPETSINSELAIYWDTPQGHNFNATVFANKFKDKIARGDSIPNCEVASPGERCANIGEGWADLGFTSFSQQFNIDRVDIRGLELAGRYKITPQLTLRGNYTYTDSEQKSGPQEGRPLNNTAKHMLNTTLDWQVNSALNLYLTMEARSKRYRSWDTANDVALFYKDYEVFHLGGSYKFNKNLTLQARVNNLLDEDFTSYQTSFTQNADGSYSATYRDDYNIKAKSRNFWLSMNYRF